MQFRQTIRGAGDRVKGGLFGVGALVFQTAKSKNLMSAVTKPILTRQHLDSPGSVAHVCFFDRFEVC